MTFKIGYTPWNKNKTGFHHTDETKIKMSLTHKGMPSNFKKGYTPWNKGTKLSENHKNKIGMAHKRKSSGMKGKIAWNLGKKMPQYSMNKHWRWKGGKPDCKDCGHKVSGYYCLRCRNCSNKFKIGENNPAWKGGRTKQSNYKSLKNKARKYRLLAAGELNPLKIQLVYEDNIKKYGTLTCYLCLKSIEFGQDNLEHKIPISRGGTNNYDNLEIAHRLCNVKKGAKTVNEYKSLFINQMPE